MTGTRVDDFTGPEIDTTRWQFLEFPLADGTTWTCRERGAQTRVADGKVAITVEAFDNAYGGHQNIDNCKHLLLATRPLTLRTDGATSFHCRIQARSINATPFDWRDGFVSFNVLDFSSGMVFDLCATSDRLFAIYERLPWPGVDRPFTYLVDAPLSGLTIGPEQVYACEVRLIPGVRRAEWRVNEVLIFTADDILVPAAVTLGFGFITLHPCRQGVSQSRRGQGLAGSWSDFSWRHHPARRPSGDG